MTDYSELVKALRYCAENCDFKCGKDCPMRTEYPNCLTKMDTDAAAAIEALQKRLVSALTALHLANEKMGYYGIQPYTEADGEDMISDWVKTLVHEELEQQLPKLGEWELIDEAEPMRWGCSRCKYLSWETSSYCPRCGAKMMEVQDG